MMDHSPTLPWRFVKKSISRFSKQPRSAQDITCMEVRQRPCTSGFQDDDDTSSSFSSGASSHVYASADDMFSLLPSRSNFDIKLPPKTVPAVPARVVPHDGLGQDNRSSFSFSLNTLKALNALSLGGPQQNTPAYNRQNRSSRHSISARLLRTFSLGRARDPTRRAPASPPPPSPPLLGRNKKKRTSFVTRSRTTPPKHGTTSEAAKDYYGRVIDLVSDMDFDESAVGSILMILEDSDAESFH